MRFSIYQTSYFLACNPKRDEDEFNQKMCFDDYPVSYKWKIYGIETRPDKMM
tara:strand:+ start:327 stop:482 length:156 start_codon:yes stop_codon:yes gene_type:complete